MNKDIINGVNVSECKLIIFGGYSFPQCKYYFDSFAPACCQHEDCTYKQLQRAVNQYNQVVAQNKDLQTELNTVKQQYNCYACGGCKGKEDYINLEKHHLGLRKQFDELYRHKGELVTAFSKENKKAILYKAALEEIRTACQYYIADERDLTPEQVIVMINEVLNG